MSTSQIDDILFKTGGTRLKFVQNHTLAFLLNGLLASQFLQAENPAVRMRPDPIRNSSPKILIDVSLVLVPVHVTTALGRPIMDMESNDFHLYDNDVELSIQSFAKDDTPISVGVLFDCSGSMRSKIRQSAAATTAFLNTANKDDEHFLVEFGDRPRMSIPFTNEATDLTARIARIRPNGRTSLFDAIHLALKQMTHARNRRKAIIIFSDGGDNWSRKSLSEIRRSLEEADVQLYAIEILDEAMQGKPTREEIAAPGILSELAGISGGNHLRSNLMNLKALSEYVGNELRSQYVLGYSPIKDLRDGKYHRLKVTVSPKEKMPDLRISHRRGYYAVDN